MKEALTAAFVFWFLQALDTYVQLGLTRPIVLATVMGIFAGDVQTGAIMGGLLEGLYMGASAIGGVKPADYKCASIVSTALVCYTGIDIETGLTIAAAIGAITNGLKPVSDSINNLLHPIYVRLADKGDYKKFYLTMFLQTLFVLNTVSTVAIFFCMLIGVESVDLIMTSVPAFILKGLSVSASVLIVVGLGLITQSIWGPTTLVYVLLGFILTKFVGLSAIVVAVAGIVLAYLSFRRSNQINELKLSKAASPAAGGDDFYD